MIVGGIVGLIFAVKDGDATAEQITGSFTAILGGIGLMFAKDNNVTGGTKQNGSCS